MSMSCIRGATEWALMVAIVFGAGAIAQAQDEEKTDGNVVQIGRADKDQAKPNLPPPGEPGDLPRQAPPTYWIGLLGGDIRADHPLRAHLDLPENQGLLVANVVPNSPAAKAGLKQHDILLKANNTDLHEMRDLIDLVLAEGPKKGQITLEILRHNKRETVYLKPEERPANAPGAQGGIGGFGGGELGPGAPGVPGMPDELLQQFRGRMPFEFRDFGPGVIVGGGGQGFANMPNGVSVSIQKQNDQPPHITVKRGNETWEVTGDDPESLKKLPNDLRPFVEQMLNRTAGVRMRGRVSDGPESGADADMDNGRLRERLERMEKRLEEMQKRLLGPNNPTTEKPNDQHEQAK